MTKTDGPFPDATGPLTLTGRSGSRVTIAAAIFAIFTMTAAAQDVPVPRPSPLGLDGGAALTAPEFIAPPQGLSPGALLDPTAANPEGVFGFAGITYGPEAAPDDLSRPVTDGVSAIENTFGNNPLLGAAPPTASHVRYLLEARLQTEGEAIPSGVTWRVFSPNPGPNGKLPLIGETRGGTIDVSLSPGEYLVHAAYGRAGATKRINVGPSGGGDAVILNAGGLKLSAMVENDAPLSSDDVSFDVYAPDEDGSDERVLLVPDAPPDQIIGLNAGIYHIICRYGDANAVVRAEIRVEAGKLTEATVYQKAARLTLKLVSTQGGEALANTKWSVLTPEGDRIVESVGAFPSVVLAEGTYTAIATNEGHNYERNFTVEAGLDRDVEVIAQSR